MSTSALAERIEESAEFLRERGVEAPRAAVMLGSGLSAVLRLKNEVSLPYGEVPGFPKGSLDGHERRLDYGFIEGCPVLVLRGRAHYYEGVGLAEAAFPVRVARALGVEWIALLNAAGGIDPTYEVGDIVFLTDHINWMGVNPLVGPNDDKLGPRFPDMSRAYDRKLLSRAESAARDSAITTRRGVYAAVSGPHFETPAEIRMLRTCGADLVGMSTVPEAIVAVHAQLRVLGISVVTDLAFPEELEPLDHEQVVRAAEQVAPKLDRILRSVLAEETK